MKNIRADAHADTLEYILDNNLKLSNKKLSFNLFDVDEYLPYLQCMSCFVSNKYVKKGYERVNKILNNYNNMEKYNKIITIYEEKQIKQIVNENKLGILLTVENGTAIDGNLYNLQKLYDKGIRQMTITWDFQNELGTGNACKYDTGLTEFGKKCIKKMNDINMIIDVSHASRKTFWDIVKYSNSPVMASHSNVYALCQHNRNLKDCQIKEIAKLDGVIGITYYSNFLTTNDKASINDVAKHIEYVSDLVGIDYVCVGSDFEGVDKNMLPQNLKGISDINKLEECLELKGFNKEEIQKVMGANLISFLSKNL